MTIHDPRPFYLDCDTGIDDALALAYLLATPQADLVGIGTVCGNVDAIQAATNTLGLLEMAGRPDIPVAIGARQPLVADFHGGTPQVHGSDGLGNAAPATTLSPTAHDAAQMIVDLAHHHRDLSIIAIGPLTNLALALRLDPPSPRSSSR